ncbi:trypsin-like serine protease [Linderina pennispora]|uniref:Trypsin-like serine protease n=1 Tax=Linderina pennispora TaxID=61395 RepID=A0A1Y1W6D7_9FUNG|nr:trypsin-like serine protease [Linderina pennispora]ORX68945.1 trypsin-like serine protease [Linderina pennispora]
MSFDKRIVGGKEASIKDYPFAVHISTSEANGGNGCAGAILTDQIIVTAAACIVGKDGKPVSVGSITLGYGNSTVASQPLATVKNVIPISSLNMTSGADNIALLQVSPAFKFSSAVNRVPLYTGSLKTNDKLEVMGWGTTDEFGAGSSNGVLEVSTVAIGDEFKCKITDLFEGIDGKLVCTANSLTPGSAPCKGDSGAPLVRKVGDGYQLVGLWSGIVDSTGKTIASCTQSTTYQYYVHAKSYLSFFTETTGYSANSFTDNAPPVDDEQTPAPITVTKSKGLSTGAIAGIAVGAVVAIIVIAILVYVVHRNRKKQQENRQADYIYELGLQQLAEELGGSYEPKTSMASSIFNTSTVTPFEDSFAGRPSLGTRYLRSSAHEEGESPFSDHIPQLQDIGTEITMDTLSKTHRYADGSPLVMEFIRPTREGKVEDYYPLLQDFYTLYDEVGEERDVYTSSGSRDDLVDM